MKTKINKRNFDCLAFKWKAQEAIYEETKGMNRKELIEYFRNSVEEGPLGEWWKSLKKQNLNL
jgi:hypothetical protein